MKRGATLLIVAICLLASILLAVFYERTTPLKHMDSVFLFESSLNVLESGHPTSSTWESYVPEVYATFTLPADEVCSLELRKEPAGGYNILDNHAYMAIYPISVLTAVAGPEGTFAILNALAHVLLVVIPCVFLVRQGAGVLAAAAFALLVAVYPVWSYSAMGDYYLDRLYMPFALLSLFTMHLMIMNQERLRDARWLGAWVAATVAAALFTERAALMMIGVIGFFLIFYPAVRKSAKALATMLTVGLVLAAYLLWYFTAVQSADTSISLLGSINTAILAERLQSPEMIAFISVNLLFMGLLVVLAGVRYTVLVLCVMLPNILITVGGAELNGWTTHYHAMYLPFTVFAAAIGFLRLTRGDRPRVLRAAVVAGVVAYALLLGGSVDPYTGGRDSQFSASLRNGIVYRVWKHFTDQADWYTSLADVARSLDAIVPQGAQVSAVEGAMPALYKGRSISMYPMNMDTADYLVAPGLASEGRVVSLSGAITYLGPEVAKSLNECLLERATAQGFQLWRQLGAGDLIVLRRDGTETSEASEGEP